MNLQENIDRIHEIMGEGKDAHISRSSFDQEYEEEYPRWGRLIVNFLDTQIDSYDENDDTIILFSDDNMSKTLMRYNKRNEELYFDYSLSENISKFITFNYVSRHFIFAVQDYFKKHFPDYGLRRITAANITKY
jgi:hypothetical protein